MARIQSGLMAMNGLEELEPGSAFGRYRDNIF